ncbi:MAG TPA: type II toxin-antitoxin system ParD family antitoxin [Bacteroidetes bacterium]|nr:type II toxin-antitoxin system ParD family antitoxin [Bacteroidota bacterium]
MNVSLNAHFNKFIENLVDSGQYNSASEVIREALRLLELKKSSEKEDIAYLRREIQKGIDSGTSVWDKEEFLSRARERAETYKKA